MTQEQGRSGRNARAARAALGADTDRERYELQPGPFGYEGTIVGAIEPGMYRVAWFNV